MKLQALLKNKEIKNAGWLIGGRVVQMLLSFVVGIFTARYLGPDNYGLINYGATFVAFFSALCNLGLNSVIIKDFIDKPKEQGEAIGSALVMRLISSVLSVAMTVGIVFVIDSGEPLTIIVVALCSLGSVFHVFETFNYWFQHIYKSKVTSIATIIAYIIISIYKIVLLILQKDVRWFAVATSLDYLAVAIVLCLAYKKHGGQRLSFSLSKACSLLKVSHHYIWSSMMVVIYGQTDKLMLKQMIDQTEVGYYSLAVNICSMWTFVLQAIIDSLYPGILRLREKDYDGYLRKNRQLYAIVFYISMFVSLAFLLLGSPLISIVYGESYLPATAPLKMITWYTAFSYLGVARNAWMVSEGKQKYLKYLYGCAAVLNVVLNFALIPILGAIGAALASFITQVCTSIILPMFFKELRPNAKLMLEAIMLKKIR